MISVMCFDMTQFKRNNSSESLTPFLLPQLLLEVFGWLVLIKMVYKRLWGQFMSCDGIFHAPVCQIPYNILKDFAVPDLPVVSSCGLEEVLKHWLALAPDKAEGFQKIFVSQGLYSMSQVHIS